MRQYDPEELYVMRGDGLNRIVRVALRLYTEKRLEGDEYRDLAQALECAVDSACEYEETEG